MKSAPGTSRTQVTEKTGKARWSRRLPNTLQIVMIILFITGLLLVTAPLQAREGESDDKTLSPYFFVKSEYPTVDQLPLKATSAAVNISGVIADVLVRQVYKNEGKKPIEAIYIFPASTRAAVYGMRMTIGKRIITAKIEKREEARRQYEEARNQGRSASLLEQQRPNVFQMNVANIMPGDEITVELKYTELLVPTDRVYEFSYPTVVGPRYSNLKAENGPAREGWVQNPYLRQDELPTYTFDMNVTLSAGLPIGEVACTSHKVNVSYDGPTTAKIKLAGSEKQGGNRDFILRYRLDGDRVQSGLLLYEGKKENFFLLMVQPPKRVIKAEIPGREYIFIVDVSGSMHGFPLEISKKLLRDLIGNLRPTDRFNVLLFSGGSSVMAEQSLAATADNISRATQLIDRQRGGGGTELLPALTRALSLEKTEGFSRTVVIATDGYVRVEEEVFDLIRNNLGDANMFAFGIGTSVNRHIIEGMAHVGMGEPFVITKPNDAPGQAERFRKMIQSPVLTGVKARFNGFKVCGVEPAQIPDVLAERPVILFGKWQGKPQGTVTITGRTGSGPYSETIDVSTAKPLKTNAALRYLWARHRITVLSDYNKLRNDDRRVKEVTELGLTYNLLTAYTSFVAIDSEVRNTEGPPTTVKQPLPLPQGVSDYAVGAAKGMAAQALTLTAPSMERNFIGERKAADAAPKPKDREPLRVRPGKITPAGWLTEESVRSVIESHLGDLQACAKGFTGPARIVVEMTVNPDGTLKNVKSIETTLKDGTARRCILNQIKKWLFPAGSPAQAPARLLVEILLQA
jgi:Ca-activated chloride channel family protein